MSKKISFSGNNLSHFHKQKVVVNPTAKVLQRSRFPSEAGIARGFKWFKAFYLEVQGLVGMLWFVPSPTPPFHFENTLKV